MLEIKNLSFKYPTSDNYILQNVNYLFKKGVVYSIIGKSGAGKSTFISLVSGLEDIKEGELLIEDKNITKNINDRQNNISVIFQSYNLIESYTIHDNLQIMQYLCKKPLDKNELIKVLKEVDLDESYLNKAVNQLSGGEQQRVGIARAMISDAKIIVADEPTGNLDEETQQVIIDLLHEQAKKHDKTVIIVTHSNMVSNSSDIVLSLVDKDLTEIKSKKKSSK